MRCTCPECGYEVYAQNEDELLSTIAADGGLVSEGDAFCPGCDTEMEIDKTRRK